MSGAMWDKLPDLSSFFYPLLVPLHGMTGYSEKTPKGLKIELKKTRKRSFAHKSERI
ncbi:MAG TPA: hypothetical protein GX523_19715 [Desulfitobacterium dehalogenans]|uniref:Uncharacterized protein n=1 Tax=Desulfitobacterium dehalogenans TaxID=36854 RepID=A0A7C7D8L5_9FIRM|nr:hypothetical protein [Desulfitobacterium dehalogenans]